MPVYTAPHTQLRSPSLGTPSLVLTFMSLAAKIHPRGSWERDQFFPCSLCTLHQQPHLPELLLCTSLDWAWKTKGHCHSPPSYSTLLGIQPPSPGALDPQLSQAAPPPISLPFLLGIPSCPHFKLAAASELPITNSSQFPMTSHHRDHLRCPFFQVLPHLHQESHTLKGKPCHSLRSQAPNPCKPQSLVFSMPHLSPYPGPSTVPVSPFTSPPPQGPLSLPKDPTCP